MRERRVGGRSKEDERRQLRQFREGEAVPEEAELNLGVVEGGKEIKNLKRVMVRDGMCGASVEALKNRHFKLIPS